MTDDRAPRRAVELTGVGVLKDGTSFDLIVLDLSASGCKVQTTYPLVQGFELTFSIAGVDGSLEATVRWCSAGRAGLQFPKEEAPRPEHPPRRDERLTLIGNIGLRRSGRLSYQVRMFDLTPRGCRVEFVERPKEGELLWAKFDGLDGIAAVVRWVDGFYGGLEFVHPIHSAVFALLRQRLIQTSD